MPVTIPRRGERLSPSGGAPVGAYPLKDHHTCPERTRKEVSYPQDLKVANTDGLAGRLAAGVLFEDLWTLHLLNSYRDAGWQILHVTCGGRATSGRMSANDAVEVLNGRIRRRTPMCVMIEITDRSVRSHKLAAERVTEAAMAAGADVILGGRLCAEGRVGEPDLLIRCSPENRRKHAFRYVAGDFKDHRSFEGTAASRTWLVSDPSAPYLEAAVEADYVGTPQWRDSFQLVHYWYLLDSVGRAGARTGAIIGREGQLIWRDLDALLYERKRRSAFDVYDTTYAEYREAVRHERARLLDDSITEASGPEWKSDCKECPWRQVCHDELREMGHITLLPGVTPLKARAHYAAGVDTVRGLATLDARTARLVDAGVDVDVLMANAAVAEPDTAASTLGVRNRDLPSLASEAVITAADVSSLDPRTALYAPTGVKNLAKAIDQARVSLTERVHRARGVEFVPIQRAAIELDVDIEDDGGGICYLIGVRESRRSCGSVSSEYHPFVTWDHTPEGEAANFAEFWAYLMGRIAHAKKNKIGTVRAFFYTAHETRYFLHLAECHAGRPGVPTVEEVQSFCDSEVWVDMYPILAEQLVWPTEDLTLKSLAKYARHMWRDETPGGANSVAWYLSQLEATETGDVTAATELRRRILDYNEDDVIATWQLREFISKMGEARRPGQKLPGAETLDRSWGPTRPRTPQRRR